MSARRFVLLDRDGTLLVPQEYLSDPRLVELMPGAGSALRLLRAAGWGLVVVTNQSAIGRGYMDEARLELIHARMAALLRREQVVLDGIYYCPHAPEAYCGCRKPATGLALRAAAEHGFAARECVVVGDNVCDIRLGENLGATTCLVRTGCGAQVAASRKVAADYVADNLWAAARIVRDLPPLPAIRSRAAADRRQGVPA